MSKLVYICFVSFIFISCIEVKKDSLSRKENELLITSKGDSLEHGLWRYIDEESGLSKMGEYENGFKTRKWTYTISDLETSVEWMCFDSNGVKFNYPKHLKLSESLEHPLIFSGDISDGDDKTYMVLLRYDLDSSESLIFDYVYEANRAYENDLSETVKDKSTKKYSYKSLDLFIMNIQLSRDHVLYRTISFIFEVDGFLYDLTMRNTVEEMDVLQEEIFKDMLYSMECSGVDLFNFGTGAYLKTWDIEFD